MLARIKRALFGCKHEWETIRYDEGFERYGCLNCGAMEQVYGKNSIVMWRFDEKKKGSVFVDEQDE